MESTGPGKVRPTKQPRRRLLAGALVAPMIVLVAVPGASARQVLLSDQCGQLGGRVQHGDCFG